MSEEIIARSYTRSRRYERVVGTLATGTGRVRLPGGPYSFPQFITTAVMLVVMVKTQPLWGSGSIGDAIAVIAVPIAAGWLMRRARIEGRSPHRALIGLAGALIAPRAGVLRGARITLPQIHVMRAQIRVQPETLGAETLEAPLPTPLSNAPSGIPRAVEDRQLKEVVLDSGIDHRADPMTVTGQAPCPPRGSSHWSSTAPEAEVIGAPRPRSALAVLLAERD